jgi:hypothetical protein
MYKGSVPVDSVIYNIKHIPSAEEWKDECDRAYSTGWIRGMESAEKQGEWLFKEITDDYHVIGQCSICKERRRIDNFCPNCGARMKGVDNE